METLREWINSMWTEIYEKFPTEQDKLFYVMALRDCDIPLMWHMIMFNFFLRAKTKRANFGKLFVKTLRGEGGKIADYLVKERERAWETDKLAYDHFIMYLKIAFSTVSEIVRGNLKIIVDDLLQILSALEEGSEVEKCRGYINRIKSSIEIEEL